MSDPVPSSAIYDATIGGRSVIVVSGGASGDVLTLQADGTYLPVTPGGLANIDDITGGVTVPGNLGVGETTPTTKLVVKGPYVSGGKGQLQIIDSAGAGLSSQHAVSFFDNTGAVQGQLYKEPTSGSLNLINTQAAPVKILTGGTDRLTISGTGEATFSGSVTGPSFAASGTGQTTLGNSTGGINVPGELFLTNGRIKATGASTPGLVINANGVYVDMFGSGASSSATRLHRDYTYSATFANGTTAKTTIGNATGGVELRGPFGAYGATPVARPQVSGSASTASKIDAVLAALDLLGLVEEIA